MYESWTVAKGESRSAGGLVACQNWRAARHGAAVLARGGNAMDAAVTTALALSVVEPWLSGIGGGGFLLHASAEGHVDTLDFNVHSPHALDPADYPLQPGRDGDWFDWPAVRDNRNLIGYGSICVPGAVAGLAEALARHGTISWAEALAPAIEEAERGLSIEWFSALSIGIDAEGLAGFPASAELFLRDGRAPRVPDAGGRAVLPMPTKARTLKRLAAAGPRDFYEGEIARSLVADLAAGGSKLDAADLAKYEPVWRAPLSIDYGGHGIHAMAGFSGGPTFIDTLAELAQTLPQATAPGEAELAYARAIRNATETRLRGLGHAAENADSCTTHLSVVDRAGNMVSLTNTLLSRFGSKVVLPGTGFLMNNGVMWFDPRPGQPNSIAGGVRPLANMCPVLATREGRPALAIGAAGGRQIFPALIQLVSYVVDRGMSLETAFHAPRLDASRRTIRVNRLAGQAVAAAVAREFEVEIVDDTLYPVHFAVASAVRRQDGVNIGMAQPRNPWAAVGDETFPDRWADI